MTTPPETLDPSISHAACAMAAAALPTLTKMNGIGVREGLGMPFEKLRDQAGGIHRVDGCVEARSCVLAKPPATLIHRHVCKIHGLARPHLRGTENKEQKTLGRVRRPPNLHT